MKLADFTIIIPCIKFRDVSYCVDKIRDIYQNVKIIISLNKINKKDIPKDKNTKIIISKFKAIGKKRNIAVDKSTTKYLAFIDSDAYPKKKWLESSFNDLKKKNIGIISGPNIDPLKQNNSQEIIGQLKKSFLITMRPNLQKNNNNNKKQIVSFMPSVNWILKKETFNSVEQMDSEMLRNEDFDFVHKMKKKNLKTLYLPSCVVYHDNNTIKHFVKKRFIYGYYMWPVLTQLNYQNFYFYLPLCFALFLLSAPLAIYYEFFYGFYVAISTIYFIVIFCETLRTIKKINYLLKGFLVLFLGNISPGFGMLLGFFNHLFKKI
jgi:GT2 family glycosyltransferase